MADFSALKTAIQANIRTNGNEEITGAILQDILLSMVSTMGDGAINALAEALQAEVTNRQNAVSGEATTRAEADSQLSGRINAEATARGEADTLLGNSITAITTRLNEGYIYAGIATPSANPGTPAGKVFYIALQAGTYTNFSSLAVTQGITILKYNGTAWSQEQLAGIDDVPTDGSNNLVKSGGVAEINGYNIDNPEFQCVETDEDLKILSYRDKNFRMHEVVGIITNSLKITNEGKNEFLKMLDDYGVDVSFGDKYLRKDINLLGSNLNNSVGENSFANGVRTNLKILGYGNSFMRNSVYYLSSIAEGCGVNLTIGNLYTGGTNLDDHYDALLNDRAVYGWYKYVDGVNTVNLENQKALKGLLDERWDAIILHQYNLREPYEPVLNQFIQLIINKLGYCPKIYLNATWAGHKDYVWQQYRYATELEMWKAQIDACKNACINSGIAEFSIIPTGTAIQNARTLSWADSYNRFVNGGDDWHHLNPAGGFIAACTIFQKIVTPLNGIPCSNTTFRITSSTNLPPQTTVEEGILVTDSNYSSLCDAAIMAVNRPYNVSQIN